MDFKPNENNTNLETVHVCVHIAHNCQTQHSI